MSFYRSFNIRIEIGDGRFISLEFFCYSWMGNSHVFCSNSFLRLIKSLVSILLLEFIFAVDKISSHHFSSRNYFG